MVALDHVLDHRDCYQTTTKLNANGLQDRVDPEESSRVSKEEDLVDHKSLVGGTVVAENQAWLRVLVTVPEEEEEEAAVVSCSLSYSYLYFLVGRPIASFVMAILLITLLHVL